ncbi:MAG: ATP-binding protein [Methanobrevibacter sp.]|jgi:hypothetical protein|nr:ATP-binding protein [Candidatus Methanoflexus mossambicus]
MKKLPKNIGNFKEIREENYIYIDKTKEIYNLLQNETKCFLSRPRRFGKTLLLDTFKELFEGNKKLFKGLYIYDKWNWNEKYPVLALDIGITDVKTNERFENSLHGLIDEIAEDNSINLINIEIKGKFGELIKKLEEKHNKKLVVLVDEYDFPIMENINKIEVAEEIRETLSGFYQVLKSKERHIKFLFLTGVSKFTKTSIFSKLNNLTDLTIDERCSTICGYSQKDLETEFKEHIKDLSKTKNETYKKTLKRIKKCYDGYSWDGKNFLYNPNSILSLLSMKKYSNYWFESGTPRFLIDLMKRDNINIESLLEVNKSFTGEFPTFELTNIDLTTSLLQTGYLTIKKHEGTIYDEYILDIPNYEVKNSLFSYIVGSYTNNMPQQMEPLAHKFLNSVIQKDDEKTSQILNILIGKIPYKLQQSSWQYYHTIFPSWFYLMGLKTEIEKPNAQGEMDFISQYKDNLIIIGEIKYTQNPKTTLNSLIKKAMKQIQDKKYYQEYQDKNTLLLAIAIKDTEYKEVKCQIKTIKELEEEYKN